MFAAQLSMNESEETIKALRPKAEEAVQELIAERGLPKNFTGVIPYNGFKIRVQRPTSFTWELNNQIDDPQIDYYKAMSKQYDMLNTQLKGMRKEMKGVSENLAIKYPNSESIKHGLTIALLQ